MKISDSQLLIELDLLANATLGKVRYSRIKNMLQIPSTFAGEGDGPSGYPEDGKMITARVVTREAIDSRLKEIGYPRNFSDEVHCKRRNKFAGSMSYSWGSEGRFLRRMERNYRSPARQRREKREMVNRMKYRSRMDQGERFMDFVEKVNLKFHVELSRKED